MRIALQTWGTEGDVRPFFALAGELVRRGHEARLLYTNVEGRDLSALGRGLGVEATAVAGEHFQRNREHLAARARESFTIGSPVVQLRRILEDSLDPVAEAMLDAGTEAARWSELVVAHFLAHPAITAAEAAGRPFATVGFAPVYPTRHEPPMGAPRLGRWLNPALWWIAARAMDGLLRPRVNPVRARAGLPALSSVSRLAVERSRLALLAVSPALVARPDDWDPRIQICGFLPLEDDAPEQLDAEASAFLDAGPPPVLFTLGSMATLDEHRAEAATRAMIEAALRRDLRAIVQAPQAVLAALAPDPRILPRARLPHAQVLPRCSTIVHHGGAGTTHAVLRAGRPSIVVPHIADQFYWAALLHRHGVAAEPLPAPRLDAARLGKRLDALRSRPEPASRAAALAEALRGDRGLAAACEQIEALRGARHASAEGLAAAPHRPTR